MAETPKISRTCEVIERWNYAKDANAQTYCGQPTAYWYPTKHGTMALCDEHAQKHLASATQIGMEKIT